MVKFLKICNPPIRLLFHPFPQEIGIPIENSDGIKTAHLRSLDPSQDILIDRALLRF